MARGTLISLLVPADKRSFPSKLPASRFLHSQPYPRHPTQSLHLSLLSHSAWSGILAGRTPVRDFLSQRTLGKSLPLC